MTWTRLAIVSFVDDLPDLKPTVARLLRNQSDIGDAINPFYGERAGERDEAVEGHITGAVELLTAAKAGDQGPSRARAGSGTTTGTRSRPSSAGRTRTTGLGGSSAR